MNFKHLHGKLASISVFACSALLLGSVLPTSGALSQTLEQVQKRGTLACGVSEGLPGFSEKNAKGEWSGFDVDYCRAIAAAIFGDKTKVTFTSLTAANRFESLAAGKVDVLARNTTWTIERELKYKLLFAGTSYYDGQGFLVPRAKNLTSSLELNNSKVCVQKNTTTLLNLGDYFRANSMKLEVVEAASLDELLKFYDSGKCNVMTSDVSKLYAGRAKLTNSDLHMILPDVISKEPLGPVVRQDDVHWFTLVRWVHFALVNAEELGVSSKTLSAALNSKKPSVQRLLGVDGNFGKGLKIRPDWVASLIKSVGNYGEIYSRNVGPASKLEIPRGLNQLWNTGGILYAPPVR